jgi:hypothetical protein
MLASSIQQFADVGVLCPSFRCRRPRDLTPLLPSARAVAWWAGSSMIGWITEDYSIQKVGLVGGGMFMFKNPLKAARTSSSSCGRPSCIAPSSGVSEAI